MYKNCFVLSIIIFAISAASAQEKESIRGFQIKEYSSIFWEESPELTSNCVYYYKDYVMWRFHTNWHSENKEPEVKYRYFVYKKGQGKGILYDPSYKSTVSNIPVDSLMIYERTFKNKFIMPFDSLHYSLKSKFDTVGASHLTYEFFDRKEKNKKIAEYRMRYSSDPGQPEYSLFREKDTVAGMRMVKFEMDHNAECPDPQNVMVKMFFQDRWEFVKLNKQDAEIARKYFEKFEVDQGFANSDIDSLKPGPADTAAITGYELREIGSKPYQLNQPDRVFYYKDLEMNQKATKVSAGSGSNNQTAQDFYFIRKVGADSGYIVYHKIKMFNRVIESSLGMSHGYDQYQYLKSYKAIKLSEQRKSGLLYKSYKLTSPNSDRGFKLNLIYSKDRYPEGLSLSATLDTVPGMKLVRIEKINRNIYSDQKAEWDEESSEGHELRKLGKYEAEAIRPYFLGYEWRGEW